MSTEPRYVTSDSATLLHVNGAWVLSDPVADTLTEIEPFPPGFLPLALRVREWARTPATRSELVQRLTAIAGLAEAACEGLVGSLIETGLLVPQRVRSGWFSRSLNEAERQSAPVFRFLAAAIEAPTYFDYTSPDVLVEDLALMHAYAAKGAPPPIVKRDPQLARIALPHPALTTAESPIERLGHLLFWGFGRLRYLEFQGYPALTKPVPSVGARHVLEAYLFVGDDGALEPGAYHYDVSDHSLEVLDPGPGGGEGTLLGVSCVFERMQWRYRKALRYMDIFYELGHVKTNLGAAAAELSLTLSEAGEPDYPLTPLVEEWIAAFAVGGKR